ncbi:MAG: sugar phosphate isomerase/epimerase family protein [Spirochaetota bacterium]
MKLSLSTFVYFRYPLVEAIKRMAAFGYDGVEIWGGRPHAYCDDMDDAHVKETRKVLDDTGIAISNFIPAQFRYPSNPAAPDEKIRGGSVDYLKKSIDAAAALGSPYVSLCPGFSMYGQTVEEGWDAMIRSFNQLLAHTRGMDLILILEPANRMESDLVVTVDDGLKAVRDVDGEMGLLVDIGHMFVNKEPLADAITKVQPYPHHFHIDDNNGNADEHMVPGDGKIQYDVFLDELKRSGYEGFLAVEIGFQYTVDPDPAVKRSIDYLKNVL